MNKRIVSAGLIAFLLAAGLSATPTQAKTPVKHAAPTTYACSTCHMHFTAAQAKKDHYKDPMDGGTLVPVKAASKKAAMGGMKM